MLFPWKLPAWFLATGGLSWGYDCYLLRWIRVFFKTVSQNFQGRGTLACQPVSQTRLVKATVSIHNSRGQRSS